MNDFEQLNNFVSFHEMRTAVLDIINNTPDQDLRNVDRIVTQKDTIAGRNKEIIALIFCDVFKKLTGLDLSKKPRLIVDIGVGVLPITTVEFAESIKAVNQETIVIGTELPSAVAAAYQSLPKNIVERFQEEVVVILGEGFNEANVQGLRFLLNEDEQPYELVAEIIADNGKHGYLTIAVSKDTKFIGKKGKTNSKEQRQTHFFNEVLSALKEEDSNPQVIQNPAKKMLAEVDGQFIATSEPEKIFPGMADLITANNVTTHFTEEQRETFYNQTITQLLKTGGVYVEKQRSGFGNFATFNKISVFMLSEDGKLEEIGRVNSDMNSNLFLEEGMFFDWYSERNEYVGTVVESLIDKFDEDFVSKVYKEIQVEVKKLTSALDLSFEEFQKKIDDLFKNSFFEE